ncbi:true [Symbiodinium sp. CCMP2456]|nr:true [Symbiodinium sp. CCMP2456]
MKGAGESPPPQLPPSFLAWSFLGAFAGMSAIGLMHAYLMLPKTHMPLLVGSFGAMSVILFSGFKTPVAQPKNCIVGNTIGGLVGVVVHDGLTALGLGSYVWLASALAVSLTIVGQEITRTVHPPGGATALIYVTTPLVQHLGYKYVFCPSFLGAVIMVAVACITNNLSGARTYPQYWCPSEAAEESTPSNYFMKFLGANAKPLPAASPPLTQTWCSFLGAFVGIVLLVGAFGAMQLGSYGIRSVIIFSAWKVPFAQPKNAILGNCIGGLTGVCVYDLMGFAGLSEYIWLGGALSVALTITLQELTNTVHPPGGATALLFVIVPVLHKFKFAYVVTPSLLGTVILVVVGCITNNLVSQRHYPQFWFPF